MAGFPDLSQVHITRRTVVKIHILRNSPKSEDTPTGIDVVSETPDGKPHIVWVGSPDFEKGSFPQEVVWKAVGLRSKDRLEIASKAGQTGFFPWPHREMTYGSPEVPSGPAQCKPLGGRKTEKTVKTEKSQPWAYSVILNPGPEQLTLDPVIIIEQ
jgi:hypothetical protein